MAATTTAGTSISTTSMLAKVSPTRLLLALVLVCSCCAALGGAGLAEKTRRLARTIQRKEQFAEEASASGDLLGAKRLRAEVEDTRAEMFELLELVEGKGAPKTCGADDGGEPCEDATDEEEEGKEEEDFVDECADGFYDHDRDAATPCEPMTDHNVGKLGTLIELVEELGAVHGHLFFEVKPVVAHLRTTKDFVLSHGVAVAHHGHDDASSPPVAAATAMKTARMLVDGIRLASALTTGSDSGLELPARPVEHMRLIKARTEVVGGLGQLLQAWGREHIPTVLPQTERPLMTDAERQEAQRKGGKLKAKTPGQLYGWVCPGCPASRGEDNPRGRWMLAISSAAPLGHQEPRLGTLYVRRKQRLTVDGHGNRWPASELLMGQVNERRFHIFEAGRLKLIRLRVQDAALSSVGHGAAIHVNVGGLLETDRCTFLANIARSRGGAIAVEGTAKLTHTTFAANYAFGGGGAIHVGYNQPGTPTEPPRLTLVSCEFVDNQSESPGGGDEGVMFGKSVARELEGFKVGNAPRVSLAPPN